MFSLVYWTKLCFFMWFCRKKITDPLFVPFHWNRAVVSMNEYASKLKTINCFVVSIIFIKIYLFSVHKVHKAKERKKKNIFFCRECKFNQSTNKNYVYCHLLSILRNLFTELVRRWRCAHGETNINFKFVTIRR